MKNANRIASKMVSILAVGAVIAATVLGPVLASAKEKKAAPVDITKLVWPPAPAPTRLRFMGEYHGEDVKGIKKQGILERLAGVQDLEAKSALFKPYGIAVDSKGRAFVSDTILKIVFVFDFEKKQLEYRGEKPPANFSLPMGLAIDATDRLFVADAERHTITVFNPDGSVVDIFGEKDLKRPVGIALDPVLNRIYVADVKSRKVAQFKLDSFEFERWIGKSTDEKIEEADADKALVSPTNLAVDPDGLLYVVDTFTNRVVVFDTDGGFVRNFGKTGQGPGKFMRPRGIALDGDGHVYVTDAFFNSLQVLSPEGKPLLPIGGNGTDPGTFRVPAGMAFDNFNRLFVVDEYNRRIQVFRYFTDAESESARKAFEAKSVAKADTGKEKKKK